MTPSGPTSASSPAELLAGGGGGGSEEDEEVGRGELNHDSLSVQTPS